MSLKQATEAAAAIAAERAVHHPDLALVQPHHVGREIGTGVLASLPLAGQAADILTTRKALSMFPGQLHEGNPVMQDLVKHPLGFILVKSLFGAGLGVATWLLRKKHQDRAAVAVSILGAAGGFVPAALNLSTIKDANEPK